MLFPDGGGKKGKTRPAMLNGTLEMGREMSAKTVRKVPFRQYKRKYLESLGKTLGFRAPMRSTLFTMLAGIPFSWTPDVPNDEHRESDGRDLRRLYSEESGIVPDDDSLESVECWPASVLEVIVSLAMAAEDASVNPPYSPGEGTRWWFWHMMCNLGIVYSDQVGAVQACTEGIGPDPALTAKVVDKWLERRYSRSGKGGLFPVPETKKDQRKVELWYQLSEYLGYVDA